MVDSLGGWRGPVGVRGEGGEGGEVGVASGPHREPSDSLRKVEMTYETAKK